MEHCTGLNSHVFRRVNPSAFPTMSVSRSSATQLLHQLEGGDEAAFDGLFAMVYEGLHEIAHRQRRKWHGDYTLNTTALVHEVYLRMVNQRQTDWKSRSHFLAVAAKAMRQILISYARRQNAVKRGGDLQRVAMEDMQEKDAMLSLSEQSVVMLLALDDLLERLAEVAPRESRVVELRFFGGMTVNEVAEVMGISVATIKRDWAIAKAWLYRELEEETNL